LGRVFALCRKNKNKNKKINSSGNCSKGFYLEKKTQKLPYFEGKKVKSLPDLDNEFW
jgi:hypothetical protein